MRNSKFCYSINNSICCITLLRKVYPYAHIVIIKEIFTRWTYKSIINFTDYIDYRPWIEGATTKSSYNISLFIYGLSFFLLGPSSTMLVIIIAL